MLASTPINTAFNYDSNQSRWLKERAAATLNVRSLPRCADAPAQPKPPRKSAKLWRLFFKVAKPWSLRQQLDLKANSHRHHWNFLFFERHNSDKYNLFSWWNIISLVWLICFASLLWPTISDDPGYFKKKKQVNCSFFAPGICIFYCLLRKWTHVNCSDTENKTTGIHPGIHPK